MDDTPVPRLRAFGAPRNDGSGTPSKIRQYPRPFGATSDRAPSTGTYISVRFSLSVVVAVAVGEQHTAGHLWRRKLHQPVELRLGQWRRQILQVHGVGGDPLEPGDRV